MNFYTTLKFKYFKIIILLVIFLSLVSLSLFFGVEKISINNILLKNNFDRDILFISRIPRTITLIITGAGLAICGLILQQIAQNKFISPTTAGTLDAAKMGILIGLIFFSQSNVMVKLLVAFLICFTLTALFTFFVLNLSRGRILLIPILGIMFSYLLNSITTIVGIKLNIIQNMDGWMIGNFTKSLKGQYEIIYILLPLFLLCYSYSYKFTISGLGKDFTQNLGINYKLVVTIGLLVTSLMVSTSVITVGALPFIDLVIPNLVTYFYGDNIRSNLPYTAIFGSIFLLSADLLSRWIIFPYELPTSVIIGVIGALFFLILIIKRAR